MPPPCRPACFPRGHCAPVVLPPVELPRPLAGAQGSRLFIVTYECVCLGSWTVIISVQSLMLNEAALSPPSGTSLHRVPAPALAGSVSRGKGLVTKGTQVDSVFPFSKPSPGLGGGRRKRSAREGSGSLPWPAVTCQDEIVGTRPWDCGPVSLRFCDVRLQRCDVPHADSW